MNALHAQGRALSEAERRTYEANIRAALPEAAVHHGDERQHDALAATLAQAQQTGHDPQALLQQGTSMRELDSADDVMDVLVWRLRRLANLPAHSGAPARSPHADTFRTKPPAHRTPNPAVPNPSRPAPRQPSTSTLSPGPVEGPGHQSHVLLGRGTPASWTAEHPYAPEHSGACDGAKPVELGRKF